MKGKKKKQEKGAKKGKREQKQKGNEITRKQEGKNEAKRQEKDMKKGLLMLGQVSQLKIRISSLYLDGIKDFKIDKNQMHITHLQF